MSAIYRIWNGPRPTTGAQVPVDTTAVLKTMLQIIGITAMPLKVKAWGFSMEGAAAAQGAQWELIDTAAIAATVTAHVASGCVAVNAEAVAVPAGTFFDFGTGLTGFDGSAEGAIVASRVLDAAIVQPTGERAWEFSLGNGRHIPAVQALRIRVLAAAAVDALCWAEIEVG